jgi:hypothetical protein
VDSVHYRCAMDVRAATEGLAFGDLVRHIAAWIRSKEGAGLKLHQSILLTSGTLRRADRKAVVHVDSLGDAVPGNPDFWALRYEHQDAEFPARRWFSDFATVRRSDAEWRLSVTISHALHPNYMGPEPPALPVTTPRFLHDLVASPEWRCMAGEMVLTTTPRTIEVGLADQFLALLQDRQRECPIVYVSRRADTGQPMVDPAGLARAIVGAGVVFVAASSETDDELDFLMLPREFRATNGTVRVYAPGLDLSDREQAQRHRYFTAGQIEALTAAAVEDQISRSLTRRVGWARVRASLASVDDVGLRRRELRRTELQSLTDAASKSELLKLFEDENVRLEAENARLSAEKTAAEQTLEQTQANVEALTMANRRAEYEARAARGDADAARQDAAVQRRAADLARGIRRLPQSVEEVLSMIEQLHGGTFAVADKARLSARDTAFKNIDAAWECLHALATVVPALVFEQGLHPGHLPERFRHETGGIELTMTEGSQTNRDSRMGKLRKAELEGKTWDVSPHIKWGSDFRVHFALDREGKRVVVGHCGDHLDTAGTRRRR